MHHTVWRTDALCVSGPEHRSRQCLDFSPLRLTGSLPAADEHVTWAFRQSDLQHTREHSLTWIFNTISTAPTRPPQSNQLLGPWTLLSGRRSRGKLKTLMFCKRSGPLSSENRDQSTLPFYSFRRGFQPFLVSLRHHHHHRCQGLHPHHSAKGVRISSAA